MSKITTSKIKRELKRLRQEGAKKALDLLQRLYFRRYYDLVISKEIRRTDGTVSLQQEVAIYLIYPEHGVLASHLFMLSELRREGISPIVVSNLPLGDHDRTQLLKLATRVIERPNVGYDFGGYRDGILDIAKELPKLERIWLLNDSVWLLPRDESWFSQARALNKDFTGATSSFSILRKTLFGTKRFDAANYRNIVWNHQTDNPNFHYGSYALCIAASILQDSGFLDYWRKLEIRNSKKHTVRRGEIGLSQWAIRRGYSHGATHEIEKLPQELLALSDNDLDRTARELVVFRNNALAEIKPKVLRTDPTTEEGRAERIGLILASVARHGSAYAMALYHLRHATFPFLKKSPLWLSENGPTLILPCIAELEVMATTYVATEAMQLSEIKACMDKQMMD